MGHNELHGSMRERLWTKNDTLSESQSFLEPLSNRGPERNILSDTGLQNPL